jgi:hypothetical protein
MHGVGIGRECEVWAVVQREPSARFARENVPQLESQLEERTIGESALAQHHTAQTALARASRTLEKHGQVTRYERAGSQRENGRRQPHHCTPSSSTL